MFCLIQFCRSDVVLRARHSKAIAVFGVAYSCVNAATGESIWRERVTGETYSSPVCIDGRIYCISRRGEMAIVAASPTFEKIAEYNFESAVHASPAVSGDRLYVRTEERLISIGKHSSEDAQAPEPVK